MSGPFSRKQARASESIVERATGGAFVCINEQSQAVTCQLPGLEDVKEIFTEGASKRLIFVPVSTEAPSALSVGCADL